MTQKSIDTKPKLSYVFVEVLAKDKINEGLNSFKAEKYLIAGLFAGIYVDTYEKEADMYYVLQTRDGRMELVHSEYFSIVSVRTLRDNTEMMYFLTCKEEDQDFGRNKLIDIQSELVHTERVLDDGNLVKMATYTKLPKDYENNNRADSRKTPVGFGLPHVPAKKAAVQGSGSSTAGCGTRPPKTYCHSQSSQYSGYGAAKKPCFFERTTKMPGNHVLENMRKKVLAVMDGTFECKPPRVPNSKGGGDDFSEAGDDWDYDYMNQGAIT